METINSKGASSNNNNFFIGYITTQQYRVSFFF